MPMPKHDKISVVVRLKSTIMYIIYTIRESIPRKNWIIIAVWIALTPLFITDFTNRILIPNRTAVRI